MNYVLIFKNDKGLSRILDIEKLPDIPVKIDNETEVHLYDDNKSLNDVSEEFQEKLKNKENTFYVVLHESAQKEFEDKFKRVFGPNVICQNHARGQFFFNIIPKLIEESMTFENIKPYFPDLSLENKLRLLHKLFGGDFNLDETEKNLLLQNNFQIDEYIVTFENNPDWKSLINLRDKILKDI